MAANTPRLSLEEQCNQLIKRQFDEVSNQRDTAISRLEKTITINKKLKDDNAGCWHIIANKQNEINALQDKNWQLQRDLDRERRERQKIKDFILSGEASQDTTLGPPHEVTTSVGTSLKAVSFSSAPNGESHRTATTGLTSEATGLTRERDAIQPEATSTLGQQEATTQDDPQDTNADQVAQDAYDSDPELFDTLGQQAEQETTTQDDPQDANADQVAQDAPNIGATTRTSSEHREDNTAASVSSPAQPKKRKKWTRRDVVETSATKRPRREPKPIAQTEAVVDQGTNVGISKFSVNHEAEVNMVLSDQRVLNTGVLGDMIVHADFRLDIMGEGDNRGGSSSYNKLIFTVVPLLIVAIPMILAFLYLRQKQHRIYAPRTFLNTLEDEEKTPKPAFGMFNWISAFRKLPDQFVLNHQTLDNYLFIRYFRMLTYICLVGTIITWVFLLRVNYNGGGSQSELDMFTFSNVSDPSKLYWHALCAWLFLGFVMFVITKETLYYINLRQAYLTTPRNATRMSTRVVLFTGVPDDMRHEKWIKADFFGVKRVWLATDCTELEKLVNDMNDTAIALEESEITLSTIATKKHLKGEKHFANDPERAGTATQQWIAPKERPSKRIAMVGRRLDSIEMYREQLKAVIPKVEALQKRHVQGYEKLLPAAFVEFETQRAAQLAYSDPFWKQPGKMEAATIGIASPDEIVWPNLAIGKPERWARTIIANTIVILLIVFWSVPVGLVGSLADIDNLAQSFPPLAFVNKLPASTKGAIGGLLPTLLISAILALVPIICRFTARKAGSITLAQIELRTQGWYFAFQVVQVFLVTTFSSGASTVAKQIWNNPGQAPKLLADNLPTASTFYLSFFILQGIAVTASTIFQIVPFLMFNVLSPFLDTTPRTKFERFVTLTGLSWGDTYPKFTLFAVIAISYSCIAPLVLGFAMLGIYFLYLAFRYNVFYVLTMAVDTKGDAYGRALQHLSVGIYLAEICLIGLMGARGADGPAKLMVVLLILTAIYQTYLNMILAPLTNTLSDKLMAENEEEALAQANEEGATAPIDVDGNGVQPKQIAPYSDNKTTNSFVEHFKRGGLFAPFLFNGSKSNYSALRRQLWDAFPGQPAPSIPEETLKHAYHHPAITAKPPKLWIVKDELGVSTQEVKETKKVIDISDEGARFNEKGKIEWDEDDVRKAPIWKDRVEY
ncbi:DUF221-domain-containing protein [Aureobasidium sp. EXF-3400]|nr:DUF221-domain-containing protein [Aureobasidium sp. EXF-12344]KAI4770512.1 DUF221-domain-containing protein [Aureobasidium sp. EXF-3400]